MICGGQIWVGVFPGKTVANFPTSVGWNTYLAWAGPKRRTGIKVQIVAGASLDCASTRPLMQ